MTKQAVLFPGQGSQFVGMLTELSLTSSHPKRIVDRASQQLGYDLWTLIEKGPAEELDKTIHTQPALLAVSYALWTIVKKKNPRWQPAFLAGHSLGEYTALVCAGAFSFEDGIHLVAARGQYMQEAAPVGQGALAAIIGLEDDDVKTICHQAALAGEVLSPANYNSIGQIVIAGHMTAVDRAIVLAKEKGARLAKRLPVSVPAHCALMKPAVEKLKNVLESIHITSPAMPVLNNVDVHFYKEPEDIRNGLLKQLDHPVRWVEIIQRLAKEGVTEFMECGPGKVLTGLNKRIVPEMKADTIL